MKDTPRYVCRTAVRGAAVGETSQREALSERDSEKADNTDDPTGIPKKRHACDLSGSEKRMQQPQTDKFGKEQYKIKMSSALREALSEQDSEKADNTNDPNEIPKKRHADDLSGIPKKRMRQPQTRCVRIKIYYR